MARDYGKVRVAPPFDTSGRYRHGKGARARHNKRTRVWDKTGGYCFYCEAALEFYTFEVEHLNARSWGGSNALENLMPSCQPCNVRKHNHDAMWWAKSKGLFRVVADLRTMGFAE